MEYHGDFLGKRVSVGISTRAHRISRAGSVLPSSLVGPGHADFATVPAARRKPMPPREERSIAVMTRGYQVPSSAPSRKTRRKASSKCARNPSSHGRTAPRPFFAEQTRGGCDHPRPWAMRSTNRSDACGIPDEDALRSL